MNKRGSTAAFAEYPADVTVNRYPPRFCTPRYQIAGNMVPAGVAFPHYENFRCGYNITSEIVPSHRVAGHQRAHQVIAGWCCSESAKGSS